MCVSGKNNKETMMEDLKEIEQEPQEQEYQLSVEVLAENWWDNEAESLEELAEVDPVIEEEPCAEQEYEPYNLTLEEEQALLLLAGVREDTFNFDGLRTLTGGQVSWHTEGEELPFLPGVTEWHPDKDSEYAITKEIAAFYNLGDDQEELFDYTMYLGWEVKEALDYALGL
jgi:hypothetical protein